MKYKFGIEICPLKGKIQFNSTQKSYLHAKKGNIHTKDIFIRVLGFKHTDKTLRLNKSYPPFNDLYLLTLSLIVNPLEDYNLFHDNTLLFVYGMHVLTSIFVKTKTDTHRKGELNTNEWLNDAQWYRFDISIYAKHIMKLWGDKEHHTHILLEFGFKSKCGVTIIEREVTSDIHINDSPSFSHFSRQFPCPSLVLLSLQYDDWKHIAESHKMREIIYLIGQRARRY